MATPVVSAGVPALGTMLVIAVAALVLGLLALWLSGRRTRREQAQPAETQGQPSETRAHPGKARPHPHEPPAVEQERRPDQHPPAGS